MHNLDSEDIKTKKLDFGVSAFSTNRILRSSRARMEIEISFRAKKSFRSQRTLFKVRLLVASVIQRVWCTEITICRRNRLLFDGNDVCWKSVLAASFNFSRKALYDACMVSVFEIGKYQIVLTHAFSLATLDAVI